MSDMKLYHLSDSQLMELVDPSKIGPLLLDAQIHYQFKPRSELLPSNVTIAYTSTSPNTHG